jgi:hypothetical protein
MEYEFTLFIRADLSDDETIGCLLAAGCDDATFGGSPDWGTADFCREAPTLGVAIGSAIQAVESVLPGRVVAVEPADLVTMSTIAERLDRTYESVRLLATGQRGDGNFPAPADIPNVYGVKLWRWADILRWAGKAADEEIHTSAVVTAVNALLELRAVTPVIGDVTVKELSQFIPAA